MLSSTEWWPRPLCAPRGAGRSRCRVERGRAVRSPKRLAVPTTRPEVARRGPKTTRDESRRADAHPPRRSEDRGGSQRHAEVDVSSSRVPGRFTGGGELPAKQPRPFRFPSAHHPIVSPDERSASPGHRVAPFRRPARTEVHAVCLIRAGRSSSTSSANRSPCRLPSRSGLPATRPPLERDGRGRDSRKTRFLVAGFHTRFVPPPPFFTTLAVYSSPRPPACFSRSRSWSWCPEEQYPLGVTRKVRLRRVAPSRKPLGSAVRPEAGDRRSDPGSGPFLASQEVGLAVVPRGGPPTGPVPWRRLLSHPTRPELQIRGWVT
jgi:hypothetical protein